MRSTLSNFTQQPLFDAASAFLGKLGIKHSGYATKEPLPLTEYFDDKMPQYLQDANATIDKLYDLGCVNDSSLGGNSSVENPKYEAMNIFAFDAKPEAKITRTVVSSLTRAFNRIADDPVILIIRQGNFVTLSTCDREKGAKAEIMGKVTILRNIDCTDPHPGHLQILDRIAKEVNGCSDFDSLYKKWLYSFSIKLLSDDFFDGYKAIYEDIIALTTGKRMKKEGNKWVERVDDEIPAEEKATYGAKVMESFAQFENPEKAVRDYVKKLMGRLVFIQFLQKKGWMGVPADKPWGEGDREFIQNVFKQSAKKDTFVDDVLEPLFRDINTDRAGYLVTSAEVNFGQRIKVPYLNGGLFEEDAYDRADFAIPAKYFWNEEAKLNTKDKDLGLLQFFAKYNFTIDENAPDDVEVGVDPEMLGRIFENLLEDNKDKGAFYTPKEIVHYMCRESLIAYLTTCFMKRDNRFNQESVEARVRKLLNCPEEVLPTMQEDKKLQFGEDLRHVKICDPAIGSGAFPMGLLNELVRCREAIGAWAKDEDGNLLVDNRAALKCEIVCNNIYGVDIERGAIDIARLRFWLSIVVDETTPQTLPNLDYKFMQGNSLITTFDGEYVNLDTKNQKHINVGKMNDEKKNLYNYKVQYYSATGDQKHKLAVQIKNSILTLIALQLDFEYRSLVENSTVEANLFEEKKSFSEVKAQLSPEKQRICDLGAELRKQLKDESKSLTERSQVDIRFFDWRMMFTEVFEGDNPGFDIVIGNPPYVDIKGMPRRDVRKYFELFSTCENRIDLYAIFIEQGKHLLSKTGLLCYINPNSMLVNESYTKLRKLLIDNISLIVKLPDSVFVNAVVETIIFMVECSRLSNIVRTCTLKNNDKVDLTGLKYKIFDRGIWRKDSHNRFNIFIDNNIAKVLSKIEEGANPLSTYVHTSLGITPYDRARGHSQELIKSRSYHSATKLDDTYVPLISGKNIRPYCITHDVEEYLKYGEWLGAPREKRFFTSPRIVIRQIVGGPSLKIIAGYCDNQDTYFTQIGFSVISKANDRNELKFLLGILNSKLMSFYHKNKFLDPEKVVFQKILIANAKEFPIKMPNELSRHIKPIDTIINLKESNPEKDTSMLEHEIDRLVYELYGLTNGEVKIIDPNETTVGSSDDLFKA